MTSSFLRDTQQELKKCLSVQGTEFALDELERCLRSDRTAIFNDLAMLKAKYNDANRKFAVQGTIKFSDEFEIVANRTRQGLLQLIDSLTEADLRPPNDSSPLMIALRALNFDCDKALRPVSLVNCDRIEAKKTYNGARRQKIGNPFHFFLVQACDLQMPHGFAERLIWEEVQKLDSDPDAQFYFKPNGPERILIQALPVTDADADETLHAFKSEFSRTHSDFFQRNFSHAAFGCALHETNWDDCLPDCLTALLQWLGELCGKNRHFFAFFFVVYIKNFDQPERLTERQKTIRRTLSAFAKQHKHIITNISLKQPDDTQPDESVADDSTWPALLHSVPAEEVEKWLHSIAQYGQAPNASQILTLFDQYVATKNPDRYQKNGPYDMRDVQELQKMIRKVAHEQAQT